MFGRTISVQKQDHSNKEIDMISKAIATLTKYHSDKAPLDSKIVDNEKWYQSLHWELMRGENTKDAEPVSAYLFSTIQQKHADIMDNYPNPNALAREESDEKAATELSEVLPAILENVSYKSTYSKGAWEKLKHGFAIYGTFWDNDMENGLGDINIELIDSLNIYWENGIEDIQDSENLFIVNLVSKKQLEEDYPDMNLAKADGVRAIEPKQYANGSKDISDKTLIVDWYYKKANSDGQKVLHMAKFIDNKNILWMSELDEEFAETGVYNHGKYPVEIDVLFPEKNTPVGFGYIDILKSPQMYVDKLDQIISTNALKAGKMRWFAKQDNILNIDDVQDYSKEVIETTGNPKDAIEPFQCRPLDAYIITHRQSKINELKEIASNNEFNRGEGGKGVTAAAAIQMLQEEGNKTSRDMIDESYRVISKMMYLVIELINQFYDEERKFRITQPNGGYKYIAFSNAKMKEQEVMLEGQEEAMYRKPIFDIEIVPEKKSPYSQAAYNNLAMELYGAGFFNPEQAEAALVALEMMQFENKEKITTMIQKNSKLLQAFQMIQQQLQQMGMENTKLKAIVQAKTGQDMGVDMEQLRKGAANGENNVQ